MARREWGPAVARAYIMRALLLKSLDSFAEVHHFAHLRPHPLKGPRAGQWALALHGRWRLIVTPVSDVNAVIIQEVSNHYGD
ncbi:MAG: plasmid maintenance system killer [Thermoflexaceae bacterium]|nr:plasmid maintenance system killer [Thermoflexaceae bacterium]